MTVRNRLFRTLWVALFLVILAVPVALFFAVKALEKSLSTERRFGDVHLRLYGPGVSPFLVLRADSLSVRAPAFRLVLVHPAARLTDWLSLQPSRSALSLNVDSAALKLLPHADTTSKPVVFPVALRFPVSVTAEWRVLTVEGAGQGAVAIVGARIHSHGRLGLDGDFQVAPYAFPTSPNASSASRLRAQVKVKTRWRGAGVSYEVEVLRGDGDRLSWIGMRDKRDLRQGTDSVEVRSRFPADWLPTSAGGAAEVLAHVSDARLRAKADWRGRNLRVTLTARTAAHPPLRAIDWSLEASTDARGGAFSLKGQSAADPAGRQDFSAQGDWSYASRISPRGASPQHTWPLPPSPRTWRGAFTAAVRGGDWALEHWKLPLEFQARVGRLDTGLQVHAHLVTRDSSALDVAWNGDRPGRLEFEGPVSPHETWATTWTDTNMSYGQATVKGAWEHGIVTGITHLKDVRAYGASADSIEAGHQVTTSAYTLESARIYKNGEVFTGSGFVRWHEGTGKSAHPAFSLHFEARHPEYGQAVFEMPRLGVLEASADNLRVAFFPYDPLARFSAFNPWVDGRFRWDFHGGSGDADLQASYSSGGNVLQARLKANWDKDSLRADTAELTAGPSHVAAQGVLPLHGHSLHGLYGLRTVMGGTWRIGADSLRIGDVYALVGRSPRVMDGVVNGSLRYSPGEGLTGEIKTGPLRIPSLHEWFEITGASLQGLGDSVRVWASTTSKAHPLLNDTLNLMFADLDSRSPWFRIDLFAGGAFRVNADGHAPDWKFLEGHVNASGSIPLEAHGGTEKFDDVVLAGDLRAPLGPDFLTGMHFDAQRFQMRYVMAGDTQSLTGKPVYTGGTLVIPDLVVRDARGGGVTGTFTGGVSPLSAHLDVAGQRVSLLFPQGLRVTGEDLAGHADWTLGKDFTASMSAKRGAFAMPPTPYRVEGNYDALRVQLTLPPPGPTAPPAKLFARASVHDFFFQRKIKIGFKDVWSFFSSFGRSRGTTVAGRRARAWDLDVGVEAVGPRNRIDTDVLRMNFIGEMNLQGVPPYTLVNGRINGLQGEVGQVQQAYLIRDLDVKWDNATLQDGVLIAEGEKKLKADCKPDTRATCMMYIKLDGRLQDVNFTYDTDCGQNTGEAVAPAVLLRSMTQGCYAAELQSGETGYGNAAVGIVEPVINAQLTSGIARRSGGFIKSTQVSGLGALMGSDTSGFEAVAVEVESKEVWRTGFKARIGYHPETKQANPTEYRVAAEYRPPLENWVSDSLWRARLKDRLTAEAAVETRPEARDIEEDRQVRQRAGLRYRYRFWGLW